jgi:hypothetical protein
MRDRMILFRDHYDADDCFNLLASQSIFLGGEVTNPSNWALPERFYNKYWFLCANQVSISLLNHYPLLLPSYVKEPCLGLTECRES